MKLWALMKKEFLRFFRDPKLIVTMLLPGIVIYLVYSLMGSAMFAPEEYEFKVSYSGDSQLLAMLESAGESEQQPYELALERAVDAETAKKQVEEGTVTAYIVFSEHFDDAVAAYDPASGEPAPQIEIYYRSGDEDSLTFYTIATSLFESYESALTNKFNVNAGSERYDFSEEGSLAISIMAGMLPFLIVVFIFAACMSVTLESVAGEKERGTLATILVTSAPRPFIALGKILPLSCISVLGATSSFIGVTLSLPKLTGMSSMGGLIAGMGIGNYALLFLLILSLVPLIVSLISIVSTLAKSVKEASNYTGVMMILVMVISLASMFAGSLGGWTVLVPLLNATTCMQGIFSGSVVIWQCLATVAINLFYTALAVLLISRLLSSERVMFGK